MAEARELAEKVEMLKLDLRKVGPHGLPSKGVQKKAAAADAEQGDAAYAASGGAVLVDESAKPSAKASGATAAKAGATKASSAKAPSKPSKPASKLRSAALVPSPQPSPLPEEEAATDDEAEADDATAPDADSDEVDRSADAAGCHSLSASLASDDWCMSNCALGNCPLTMCSTDCSSLKSAKSSESSGAASAAAAAGTKELVAAGADAAATEDGLEPCRSLGEAVDDGWCVSNCALGNCPEAKCSAGCLRPGKGGASKKPAQAAPVESPAPSQGKLGQQGQGEQAKQERPQKAPKGQQQQQEGKKEKQQEQHMVNVPPAASKATSSKNVVKKSSKKGSSKVEVWGADVVHPKKGQTNLDAFLRGEDKA